MKSFWRRNSGCLCINFLVFILVFICGVVRDFERLNFLFRLI